MRKYLKILGKYGGNIGKYCWNIGLIFGKYLVNNDSLLGWF